MHKMIRYMYCYFKVKATSFDVIQSTTNKGKEITSCLINKLQSSSKAVVTKDEIYNYKNSIDYLCNMIELERSIDHLKKSEAYKSNPNSQELKEQLKIFDTKPNSLYTKKVYDFFCEYQSAIISVVKSQNSK